METVMLCALADPMPSTLRRSDSVAALAACTSPAASMIRRMRIGPMPSVIDRRSQCWIDMSALQCLDRFPHPLNRHIIPDHHVPNPVRQHEPNLTRPNFLVVDHCINHRFYI